MKIGDPIPLGLQLFDLDATKFVRARIFLADATEHPDSPVSMPHIADGFYEDDSVPMPNSLWVHCTYQVYNDAAFTQLSDIHQAAAETIFLDQAAEALDNFITLAQGSDLTAKMEEDDMLKAKLVEDEVLRAVIVPEAEVEEVINIIEGTQALVTNGLNGSGADQPAFKAWAYKDDNTLDLSDADEVADLDDFAGVNVEPVADGEEFQLVRSGRAIGALAGMGCTAGDIIYMGSTPGSFTKTPPAPGSTVFVIGQAEPTNPDDIGPANDLFVQPRLVG